jgi:membrane protease subunit HflK
MGRKTTAVLVTIVVNLVLIGIKFLLANISGSLSLRASGWHSLSDVLVSTVVLVGLFLAERQRFASKASRIEHWISLVVAGFIFYVGYDIFREALSSEPPELQHAFWVALGALLTIVLSYFMARYKTYVGRQTNSPALVADGQHSLMDMYSSIVVVAGLFGYAIGFRNLDRVAAVVVVLFIAFAGYEIARDALAGLSGGEHGEHNLRLDPQRMLRIGVPLLLLALAVAHSISGFYIVAPGNVALVRRLGRVLPQEYSAGLQYRIPWPIENVSEVPVAAVQRASTGATLMLTGDQNLVNISAVLHYRVGSARDFVLNVDDPALLLQDATAAALRQVIGLQTIDALLTDEKAAIQSETQRQLQERLDARRSGLQIVAVQLETASPPQQVAAAFLDVASAREDRATYIHEAQAYKNEILPLARAEAAKLNQDAEAYKAEKIASAQGEATRFASRLAGYTQAPEITRTRLYLEAVEKVLPRVQKFLLSPGVSSGSLDLWLSRGGAAADPAVTLSAPQPTAQPGAARPGTIQPLPAQPDTTQPIN